MCEYLKKFEENRKKVTVIISRFSFVGLNATQYNAYNL